MYLKDLLGLIPSDETVNVCGEWDEKKVSGGLTTQKRKLRWRVL